MKRTIIIVLAFVILLLTATGCGKTYELPWDQFCVKIEDHKEIVISTEDKDYIIDLLNKGKWVNDLVESAGDFVFYTKKQELHYSSMCGSFNDGANNRCLIVTEEQRQRINRILNVGNDSTTDQ